MARNPGGGWNGEENQRLGVGNGIRWRRKDEEGKNEVRSLDGSHNMSRSPFGPMYGLGNRNTNVAKPVPSIGRSVFFQEPRSTESDNADMSDQLSEGAPATWSVRASGGTCSGSVRVTDSVSDSSPGTKSAAGPG